VNWYSLLKFLHVLSVVLWIGGVTSLGFVGRRAAKERNRALLLSLLEQGMAYGQRVVGPAAGVVVFSGLAMGGIGHLGYGTFWVLFGYGAILVQALLGGFVMQKRAAVVRQLASAPSGNDAALDAASRRLWNTQLLYIVLFAIIIAAMVIKPTL
jgi:putative copper export protein